MTSGLLLLTLISPLLALSSTACVKLPHQPPSPVSQFAPPPFTEEGAARPIDINTASAKELERLPGIGPGLAARIISHRAEYGRFRRAEHLLIVRGIGERRFRRLRPYITV